MERKIKSERGRKFVKVLILNGNPKSELSKFDQYLVTLTQVLQSKGSDWDVQLLNLRELKLHDCIGCYSCWLKTPGICCFKDDQETILKEYIASDVVLFASPVVMGFSSSLLKRVKERLLPMVHPFLCITGDRTGHLRRYGHYPAVGLLLDGEGELDKDSREIIEKVYKSAASIKFLFTKDTTSSPEEVAYAIDYF